MKKILIACTVFLAATFTANAQERISVGPMAGFNMSKLAGDVNPANRTGLNLGGFLNYSTDSRFGLRTELLYSGMGTKYSSAAQTNERNLHYIQLPVLATMYLNERGNDFRPKLLAGPYVSYLAKATNEGGANINDGGKYYNSIDLGVKAGAGFNYKIGDKSWFNYELYYNHGLTDVDKVAPVTLKNRGWGMNFGVSFPLAD